MLVRDEMKEKVLRFIVGAICLSLASLILISPAAATIQTYSENFNYPDSSTIPPPVNFYERVGTSFQILSNTLLSTTTYDEFQFNKTKDWNANGTEIYFKVNSTNADTETFTFMFSTIPNETGWAIYNDAGDPVGTASGFFFYDHKGDDYCQARVFLNGAMTFNSYTSGGCVNTGAATTYVFNVTSLNSSDVMWLIYKTGNLVRAFNISKSLIPPLRPTAGRQNPGLDNAISGMTIIYNDGLSGPSAFYSSLSLNTPSNLNRTVNYTRQINFTFTPLFNETIINCTLFTNESGTFLQRANISSVVNNTIQGISPQYNTTDTEGNILWNIRCRGASSDVWAATNYTLQIDRTAPVITINYPSAHVWSMNKTNFTINYSVSESISNLYRGNLSLFYGNGTFVKNLLYYNDLNQTSLNESRTFSWNGTDFTDYFVEICFSDDEAASPVKSSYSVKKAGLFGIKKEELIFQDDESGTDVSGTLEIITKQDNKKHSVNRGDLEVIAYKTKDDKHIVYGGTYEKASLPDSSSRFRYVYHSNNNIPLKIINPSMGLFHADTGMKSVFWQHRSLIEKGWKIETYMEGPDVVVEFWKDSYKDIIDFDPLSGGINYNCVNSSLYTKSFMLNITAVDYVANTSIMNFTVKILGNYNSTQNTTSGNIIFPVVSGSYYINVSSPRYVPVQQTFTINESDMNKTVYLFENNSVLVYIKDEDTGALITENVTCRVTSIYGETTAYTSSGQYFISQLTPAEYSFRFSSTSYSERAYNLSVSEQTAQTLTAYLSKNTDEVIFTVMDKDTGSPLENVFVTMYRTINSSWSSVESRFTDITGRAQLSYTPSVKYKFLFTVAGYDSKLFYLDPVLFSSYDILMTKITVYNSSQDFSQINLWYTPKTFIYNNMTYFDFFVQSPFGELLGYGFNISYPGGSYAAQGSNAIGGEFNYSFKITATTSDTVTVEYFYNTSIAGRRNFKDIYHMEQFYNDTYMSNKNKTYGMGLFERVLVATILVIIITGILTTIGLALPGLAIGLGAYGYLSYIGFLPLWSILPGLLVGVVIVLSRSE